MTDRGDPLGLFDPIRRDVERLTGRGAPRLPLPLPPPFPEGRDAGGEPATPGDLLGRLPTEIDQTARTGLDLLMRAPEQVARDLTTVATNLLRLPREVAQELFRTPGQLAQRLAPANVNRALETVRESADFRDAGDPRLLREKMRTITDVIDLFTPT